MAWPRSRGGAARVERRQGAVEQMGSGRKRLVGELDSPRGPCLDREGIDADGGDRIAHLGRSAGRPGGTRD